MVKKNRKRDFFKEDSPHGFVKRLMLKKYLQAYIEKTQNEKFTLDTVFIDGFAGEGRYSNDWPGEIEKYGSPLIALMVVLGFYYKRDKKEQKKCNEEKAKLEKTSGSRVLEDKNKKIEKKERTELCARASKESSEGSTEEKLEQLPGLESECKTATNADKGNIWGWLASELDPRDDLVIELEKKNRRREFVDRHSRINLIFIESDPKRYQKLAANVELLIIKFLTIHYPMYEYGFSQQERKILLNLDTGIFSIKIEIVNKKFAETAAPRMLQDKAVRSLTFLDPYGFKHTPMSHLKKFVPGTGNEILINFMSSFVNRFVSMCYGDVAKLYGIDVQDLEDEDGKAEFVQSLIRFCEPERRHEFSNNINICTVNYEAFLKTNTKCEFSLTFEIKDTGNTTFFHMVHITNHIKGVEAMKESMNRCSQEEGKMVMSDFDILRKGQKLELGNMDDPKNVAEVIFCEFRGRKRVPISDINSYVLLETPYLFRKRPLAQLQKAKNITEVVNNYGKPQSKFCTFPDKDSKTEKPINWFLSFADEGYRSESNDDPESDIKEN